MEREPLHDALQPASDRPADEPSSRRPGGGTAADGAAADELWRRVLQYLQFATTRASFEQWLHGTEVLAHGDGGLQIGVRDSRAVDWLTHRLKPVIERAFSAVTGEVPNLEFVVAPAQGSVKERRPTDTAESGARSPGLVRVKEVRDGSAGQKLAWTDVYIKLKVAFRRNALATLRGAKLSVFLCLALHVDQDGIVHPGIEAIMRETGYGRTTVCRALDELVSLRLIRKCDRPGSRVQNRYEILGYAWMGSTPAPSLWEVEDGG